MGAGDAQSASDSDRAGSGRRRRRRGRRRGDEAEATRPSAATEPAEAPQPAFLDVEPAEDRLSPRAEVEVDDGPEPSPCDGCALSQRWDAPTWEPDPDGDDVYAPLADDDAPEAAASLPDGELVNWVRVRLPDVTALVDCDAGDFSLARGDQVVVNADRGHTIGKVVAPSMRRVMDHRRLRRVLRRADDNDDRSRERTSDRAREALSFARERVRSQRLGMKLSRADFSLSGSKLILYFSAEGRVDFRGLVRELAQRFRTRIEMRQMGVRDEAKMVGGLGSCGAELCSSRFLTRFEPVSIRMAKDQNLVLNPQKVTGQCGRLKCCLAYEQQAYREARKGMPKMGKMVETPSGNGRVVDLDILRRKVRVSLSGGVELFDADDVQRVNPPRNQPTPKRPPS